MSRKEKIKLDKPDKEYFIKGLQESNAVEVLNLAHFIEDRTIKASFEKESYKFMQKEIGRRCGAIFSKVCREIKKQDFEAVENILTGGKSANESDCNN